MPETRKYTVVDLFAGVGGLSYGFSRNEHYEIILANEMQKDIAKAYTLNHPAVNMLQGDIKDLSEDVLRQTIGNRTVDVVVGDPPCQSYSTLGKRQMDARANLFMEYKRVLCILHPTAFLFENVKGILSMDKGTLFEHVRKEFEDIGYSLQYKILNAVDYGVPQLRERVILVGFLGENDFQYPEPTHGEGLLPYVTLQNALKDLPALACGEESTMYAAPPDNEFLSWVRQSGSDTLTEHKSPNNSAHLRRIMAALKDGQGNVEADDDAVNEAMNSDELIAYAVGVLYDLAAYMRPQWLDGEDTGMTLEAYFGDSICQTRNGFVTMDKKGYSFDLED